MKVSGVRLCLLRAPREEERGRGASGTETEVYWQMEKTLRGNDTVREQIRR